MIDVSIANAHAVAINSAEVNLIVEALTVRVQALRAAGSTTPELNALIDRLDALINVDFAEDV